MEEAASSLGYSAFHEGVWNSSAALPASAESITRGSSSVCDWGQGAVIPDGTEAVHFCGQLHGAVLSFCFISYASTLTVEGCTLFAT